MDDKHYMPAWFLSITWGTLQSLSREWLYTRTDGAKISPVTVSEIVQHYITLYRDAAHEEMSFFNEESNPARISNLESYAVHGVLVVGTTPQDVDQQKASTHAPSFLGTPNPHNGPPLPWKPS
jgi:hypothetical protein